MATASHNITKPRAPARAPGPCGKIDRRERAPKVTIATSARSRLKPPAPCANKPHDISGAATVWRPSPGTGCFIGLKSWSAVTQFHPRDAHRPENVAWSTPAPFPSARRASVPRAVACRPGSGTPSPPLPPRRYRPGPRSGAAGPATNLHLAARPHAATRQFLAQPQRLRARLTQRSQPLNVC